MPARLTHSADFERLLSVPARLRSVHFALHHLAAAPLPARRPAPQPTRQALPAGANTVVHSLAAQVQPPRSSAPVPGASPAGSGAQTLELSTDAAPTGANSVDKFPLDHWLGCIVPKRHAKRAVTRSLLKRQIRCAFVRHAGTLPAGQWLVRLRAPFARDQFVSASSPRLAAAARAELDALLQRAVR